MSRAEYWVEDGMHVIRSLDFDVIAGDPDFSRALKQFGEKAQSLWEYLSGLESISDHENETFVVLARRFTDLFRELERREEERRRKLISINFRRRRGEHNWQPVSTPGPFSQPSPA